MSFKNCWTFLFKLFVFLRILPASEPNRCNIVMVICWTLFGVLTGAIALYSFYYQVDFAAGDFSVSKQFSYVVADLLITLQGILGFAMIAYLLQNNPLVTDQGCVCPQRPWFFVIESVLGVGSLIPQVAFFYGGQNKVLYYTSCTLWWMMKNTSMTSLVYVIGVASTQFIDMIEEVADSLTRETVEDFRDVLARCRELKERLQPMLLFIICADLLNLILNTFLILHNETYVIIPYTVQLMLEMTYIVYVIDDCHLKLKSTLPGIR